MNVTTNGACPRSYVTHIFRYAYVGHGGDRKILELVMSVKTSDFLLSIQRLSGNHDMTLKYFINWVMYTPCASVGGMLLHINIMFTMDKLK